MRSYLSYFVSQNPKTIKSLSVFKDDTTSSYRAFDEEGNVEDISTTTINRIQNGSTMLTAALSSPDSLAVTLNLPDNVNMGSFFIDRAGYAINPGAIVNITVNSNLITSSSIIFTSLESIDATDAPIVYISSKSTGSAVIRARVIWNTNPDATQDSFRVNFMIINPS